MTENDTFKALKRRPMLEVYHEWMASPIAWDSVEASKWFEDRNWNREEFNEAWIEHCLPG